MNHENYKITSNINICLTPFKFIKMSRVNLFIALVVLLFVAFPGSGAAVGKNISYIKKLIFSYYTFIFAECPSTSIKVTDQNMLLCKCIIGVYTCVDTIPGCFCAIGTYWDGKDCLETITCNWVICIPTSWIWTNVNKVGVKWEFNKFQRIESSFCLNILSFL